MKRKKRKINLAGLRFAFKAGDDRTLEIIAGLMIYTALLGTHIEVY